MIVAPVTHVDAECVAFMRHHGLTAVSRGTDLELDDAVGSGAFGTVHLVAKAGRTAAAGQLVAKVFDADQLALDGGPEPVLESIAALYGALPASGRRDWPDLVLALPFQIVTALVNGREHLVALMIDLFARGYATAPLTGKDDLRAYRKCPLDERTKAALSFAERVDLLAGIGFIHGDLNPENLLWNPATFDVQVIDFDGGVIATTGMDRPRVAGKGDACMPPEVQDPNLPLGVDHSKFTLAGERWSYGALIGYWLFTVHPGFFLSDNTPTMLEAYAKAPERWPDIDRNGPLLTRVAQNRGAYVQILPTFKAVPPEVGDLFAALFDAGLNGDARPTADDWITALDGLSAPPTVEITLLTDDIVLEGDDVVVAWRAKNASHVELAPGGRQAPSGSLTFVAKEHVRVSVTGYNAVGTATIDGPTVRVMPLPRVERVALPSFPGFALPPLSMTAPAPGRAGEPGAVPLLPALVTAPRLRAGRSVVTAAPGHASPPLLSALPARRSGWGRRSR